MPPGLLLRGLVLASAFVVVGPVTPSPAGASVVCGPPGPGRASVALVVDDGAGAPVVRCVDVPETATGRTVLQAAGIPFRVGTGTPADDNQGPYFVCGILGVPVSGCAPRSAAGGFDYWAHYRQRADAPWAYARVGVDGRLPSRCSVEGWRRVRGGGVSAAANSLPRVAPPAVRCEGTVAPTTVARPAAPRPTPPTQPPAPRSSVAPASPRGVRPGSAAAAGEAPSSGGARPGPAPSGAVPSRAASPSVVAPGAAPPPSVAGVTTVAPTLRRSASGGGAVATGPTSTTSTPEGSGSTTAPDVDGPGPVDGRAEAAAAPGGRSGSPPWAALGGVAAVLALGAVAAVRSRRGRADR